MSSNQEKIRVNYKDALMEDQRFFHDKASQMESFYTKKYIGEYISLEKTVIEIGCGTGHYGMYFAKKCNSYLGIDITPENITLFNQKIMNSDLKNIRAQVGDATKLEGILDKSYDLVLILGPMYHLPPEERNLVIYESRRICKEDGILIFAYINKVGAYLGGCFMAPEDYPSKTANDFVFNKGTDDVRPEVFFFTTPEEMEMSVTNNNLTVIKNVGVDFSFCATAINAMSDKQLEDWMVLSNVMSQSPSCVGVSNHALLICKNSKSV
ncbi:class I SAM-dependent methyltransferase [Virgibacillus salexigens]|uniref:class I SAM-dependent methyltransferase n=1 Tax=Virgibacillus salexigens TaxID=61016 RepID=UPI001909FC04|nr:class I SAM-dependent methyltransferase [Virgibacillus salexigens]